MDKKLKKFEKIFKSNKEASDALGISQRQYMNIKSGNKCTGTIEMLIDMYIKTYDCVNILGRHIPDGKKK